MTSLKSMSGAVLCDKLPLVRTVRCRTVAKTLSIGLVTRFKIPACLKPEGRCYNGQHIVCLG